MDNDPCIRALNAFRVHENFLRNQLQGHQRHRAVEASELLKALDVVMLKLISNILTFSFCSELQTHQTRPPQ